MNMVESVARAICLVRGHNPDLRQKEYGQSSYEYWTWELFANDARAAIEAMKEPTEAMVNAGTVPMDAAWGYSPPIEPIERRWATEAWQAMISAALEEAE